MLEPGEEVKAHVFGTQCDPPTSKSGKVAGALAVTDLRFLFVGKSIASKKGCSRNSLSRADQCTYLRSISAFQDLQRSFPTVISTTDEGSDSYHERA